MTMRERTTLILTLCCGSALAFIAMPGCEDAVARQRAEFQQTIQTASSEFRMAGAARPDPEDANAESVRSELRAIVSRLSPPMDVDAGQQAAAHLLTAQALHELAAMDMVAADRREREHRLQREDIARAMASGSRLAALADGHAAVTTAEQRSALQRERQRLDAELNDLAARVRELDPPIGERSQHNTAKAQRVRELRSEANDLLRRALELGHARGFPHFERSVDVRREADRLEHGIAQREIELDLDLNPEHALASTRREHVQAMVESIHATLNDLAAYERIYGDQAGALRAEVAKRREAVLEGTGRLNESVQELASLYEQMVGHLERAANSARQASSRLQTRDRDAATTARLFEARSQESLGNALRTKVRGLDEQTGLLSRLVESEAVLGDVDGFRTDLEAVASARQSAVERARTAYEAAQQLLEQMPSGRAPEALNAYRANLQAAIAALAGEAVDWTAVRAAQSGGELDQGFSFPSSESGERGFASVEEAVAAMRAVSEDDIDAMRLLANAMHATTPLARTMVAMTGAVVEATYELERAMVDQFGAADLGDALGAMSSMAAPPVGDVRITSRSDEHATLVVSADGEDDTVELVNIDGRWMIDADAKVDDGPEAAMMMSMMEPMLRGMIEAIRGLAAQVRAGRFASPDEVAQALMQQMMGGAPGNNDGMGEFELPQSFEWPGDK
jgi:hypothetical protein